LIWSNEAIARVSWCATVDWRRRGGRIHIVTVMIFELENHSVHLIIGALKVRSNQRDTKEWESANERAGESEPEGEDSICIHLQQYLGYAELLYIR